MPGDGKTVAAVVAGTADDPHPLDPGEAGHQGVEHTEGGVLHQDRTGHAELFDRPAIDLPHGGSCQDPHTASGT
ncbi:MAG: hypothetical protein BWX64_01526 [Acidobacteria bacterium ADurb.Bin051]|nr:MAG: hypothetical protein BWX64_01526 [Acidobacteria bacterium ADurb.Bin051]